MTWCWFGHLLDPAGGDGAPEPAPMATAAAADADGVDAGLLMVWPYGPKPLPTATRMDARLVDPDAPEAWVSLVDIPAGRAPLYDDPAVSAALRRALAHPLFAAYSTLTRDSTHFAGSVTVSHVGPEPLADDPFAGIGPAQVLHVGPGFLGMVLPPCGPGIQRYAGQPWPVPGFPG